MYDNSNNTTNKNILTGKGLEPISNTSPTLTQSGITSENRGQSIVPGFRLDMFSANDGDDKNGK